MIKTIIFDLGGVIVPLDFERGYAAIAERCPYPASEIPKRIGGTDLVRRFESGQIQADEFVHELSELLSLKVDFDEFCRLWSSIFLPDSFLPESLITGLRKRYRLVLLSNTNVLHFRMLKKAFPLLGHFDAFVLSYEVGAMKPAPEIYREAIKQSNCRPEECFFTDDVQTYVDGARQAGIDAVRFQSLERLTGDLRSRSVVWEE